MKLFNVPRLVGANVGRIVAAVLALLILVATGANAQSAKDLKKKYPKMAPLEEYLMDRNAEIALASGLYQLIVYQHRFAVGADLLS